MDERLESYCWALQQLHQFTLLSPKVVFTDGDTELARAIFNVWPEATHLLCRFHIAQNITRALAGVLRTQLSKFLDNSGVYVRSMICLNSKVNSTSWRWNGTRQARICKCWSKEEKWAFAFTHDNFVAGISSTQGQEMINYQVKSGLLNNSTLSRLIDGFEKVERNTASKLIQAPIDTKLMINAKNLIISAA